METDEITGGCACGAVRLHIRGTPVRAGICHCLTCRKGHAAANNPFAVYLREQIEVSGELRSWQSSPNFVERFCPVCGSRVIGGAPGGPEVEISLGCLDETGQVVPQYESWVIRREPWLAALDVPQYPRDPA